MSEHIDETNLVKDRRHTVGGVARYCRKRGRTMDEDRRMSGLIGAFVGCAQLEPLVRSNGQISR